jgi:hypothetical protein
LNFKNRGFIFLKDLDKIDKQLIIDLKEIFENFLGQYDEFLLEFI